MAAKRRNVRAEKRSAERSRRPGVQLVADWPVIGFRRRMELRAHDARLTRAAVTRVERNVAHAPVGALRVDRAGSVQIGELQMPRIALAFARVSTDFA